MREQKILDTVGNAVVAGIHPDFADLLRRIEADGGESTAPQMTTARSGAGKVIAYTAAGVVAAAALGTVSFIGLSMGSAKSESFAADMECEAPMASESASGDSYHGYFEDAAASVDAAAPAEPETNEEPVSDSDVSDSDVSGGDADEVN